MTVNHGVNTCVCPCHGRPGGVDCKPHGCFLCAKQHDVFQHQIDQRVMNRAAHLTGDPKCVCDHPLVGGRCAACGRTYPQTLEHPPACTPWRGEDGKLHHDPGCHVNELAAAQSEVRHLTEKLAEMEGANLLNKNAVRLQKEKFAKLVERLAKLKARWERREDRRGNRGGNGSYRKCAADLEAAIVEES